MASAQTQVERFERQLEQIRRDTRDRVDTNVPAEQRTYVDAGGYFTLGFLTLDDRDGHDHVLVQPSFTGYGKVNIDGVHEFFIRGRATYSHYANNDAFIKDADNWSDRNWDGPVLEHGTYKFDLARAMQAYSGENTKYNIVVQGGRQLVNWGNGLVLSKDLDGGVITFSYDKLSLQAMAGVTVKDEAEVGAGRLGQTGDTSRTFAGALLSYELAARHRPFVYGLVQLPEGNVIQDFDTVPASGTLTGYPYEYESHYIGWGSQGSFTDNIVYGIEAAYQGGERQYSYNGMDVTVEAFALDAQLDYVFNDANKTRISSEFVIATGDGDPLGDPRDPTSAIYPGRHESGTDRGFNAFGLINTGLAFNPNVNNLIMGRLGVSTYPFPTTKLFKQFQIGIDGLVFAKYAPSGPTDDSYNHVDATDNSIESSDSFLGGEFDLYANWRITSDLSLAVRYGVFIPGNGITTESSVRQFLYTGITLDF